MGRAMPYRIKVFSACNDLPYLNSFLHWTCDPSSGTAQIAYRHTGIASPRWVVWAIKPEGKGMVGSQEGELSFVVSDLSATYSNNEVVVFATLELPKNTTTVNQVWQDGPVSNDSPGMHDLSGANVQSMAALNLLSGQSGTTGTTNSKIKIKYIHGVLNAISWGIMMPLGAVIARLYWNIFHHSVGYAVIILSIINVFKGFNILNPDGKLKKAYIGVIAARGIVAAYLEVYTWIIVVRRKKSTADEDPPNGINGTNGV
ncbi:auxin-responsive family protein [Actinidia rufa]|uniref:Auxin-responsive family protein n=1 Tax=Actinidia rufa TaxID=165716 RepID=A0A7J0DWW6_9ERIC|nr:auxin-responsive family protein [Actinidia rufa]